MLPAKAAKIAFSDLPQESPFVALPPAPACRALRGTTRTGRLCQKRTFQPVWRFFLQSPACRPPSPGEIMADHPPTNLTTFPHVPFQPSVGDIRMFVRMLAAMASISLQPYKKVCWYHTNAGLSRWGRVTLGRFRQNGGASNYPSRPSRDM
jgi:hypothetical protein